MANLAKKVVRTGKPAPGSTVPEGTIIEVVSDEIILDPNDPRAVSTPAEGLGGANVLAAQVAQSPNEAAGDSPSPQVNPHTGEVVVGGDEAPTELSPSPPNVNTPDSVDDLVTPEDVAPTDKPLADEIAEADQPEPVGTQTPPEADAPEVVEPTNPPAVEPTPDPEPTVPTPTEPVPVEPVPTEENPPVDAEPTPEPAPAEEPAPSE